MVRFDFSPYYRSSIGFDRIAQMLENANRVTDVDNGYPPYNIEQVDDDAYRLTLAVAGFAEEDIAIEVRDNALHVEGRQNDDTAEHKYLHKGIAGRAFAKKFNLADHVKVDNAWLSNGVLTVDLVRELPEEMKPRTIKISDGQPKTVLGKAQELLSGDKEKKQAA